MKLITWNCNRAYRKKAKLVLKYDPDIVVIPECEHPDKLKFEKDIKQPGDVVWFGNNHHQGLGIVSYSDYKIQLSRIHNPEFRIVLPLIVSNNKNRFLLFAVWANNPDDKPNQYVGQVWKAINFYSKQLKSKKTILVGDFNSNAIWDKPRREGNHSTVVGFLEKKGIHSTYHKFFKQEQGKEEHSTLYMYRHKNKPYHLDYCFASKDLIEKLKLVEVGNHKDWCKHSDHTPVIVSFDI